MTKMYLWLEEAEDISCSCPHWARTAGPRQALPLDGSTDTLGRWCNTTEPGSQCPANRNVHDVGQRSVGCLMPDYGLVMGQVYDSNSQNLWNH